MQGGRNPFFGFGNPFGGFGHQRSLVSESFGGRNPFDDPFFRNKQPPFGENRFGGLRPYSGQVGLPESRVLYTVLRSPHIDKKSREQFEMKIKKQFSIIKTEKNELGRKLFWLKRQRRFGCQMELVISFCCSLPQFYGKEKYQLKNERPDLKLQQQPLRVRVRRRRPFGEMFDSSKHMTHQNDLNQMQHAK